MKKFIVFVFVFLCSFIPCFADTGNELPSQTGEVINVTYDDNENIVEGQNTERQIAQIRIKSGMFKGETVTVENMLTGNPAYDIQIHKGDKVILHVEAKTDNISSTNDINYYIADIKRDNILWLLFGVFCLCLVLIGKKKGVFSLISIIATLAFVFVILVPLILHGICPVLSALIVGILSTITTIYFVGGLNAKSTAAITGTSASLILAAILSTLTISLAKLTGFAGEENLFLFSAHQELNFKGILAASMMLAALGALMDTAVSIASTINEIHNTDDTLGVKALFKSGMNVGKDIIGTMSNTLILVYMGSALPLILLSNNIDFQKFFNLNQVATEISSALIGSIAILACVPFTAIIAAVLIKKSKPDINTDFDFNK